jgi:hypothetical protein
MGELVSTGAEVVVAVVSGVVDSGSTPEVEPAPATETKGADVVTVASIVVTALAGLVVISSPVPEQATTTRPNSSHLTRFNPLPLIAPGHRS